MIRDEMLFPKAVKRPDSCEPMVNVMGERFTFSANLKCKKKSFEYSVRVVVMRPIVPLWV